jgi:hypothetical protein
MCSIYLYHEIQDIYYTVKYIIGAQFGCMSYLLVISDIFPLLGLPQKSAFHFSHF